MLIWCGCCSLLCLTGLRFSGFSCCGFLYWLINSVAGVICGLGDLLWCVGF